MIRQPFVVPIVNIEVMHGSVRTLEDMSEDEIRAIELKYGMPVRPRSADSGEQLADGGGEPLDPNGGRVQAHENAVPMVQTKKKDSA